MRKGMFKRPAGLICVVIYAYFAHIHRKENKKREVKNKIKVLQQIKTYLGLQRNRRSVHEKKRKIKQNYIKATLCTA